MADTPLMEEARELIAFYDARKANWECALTFILLRGWMCDNPGIYNRATHFVMPKQKAKYARH